LVLRLSRACHETARIAGLLAGMSSETPCQFGARMTGAVAAALAMSIAPQAAAQSRPSPLAQGLLDMPANDRPAAERYQTPDGRVRFVLDRSGQRLALVKFDGSDEVHVLRAVPGPRGDDIYKTDTGDVLLRVTALGAVTVYTDPQRLGAPAALAGRGAPVAPPSPPPGGLQARMEAIQRDLARRGHAVSFAAPNERGPASGVIADAAARAAEGLAQSPQAVTVRRVVIRYGDQPQASVSNENLHITVTPQLGYAGRPSAAAVKAAIDQTRRPAVETAGVQGPER
jgi:hypothetical protein